MYKSDLDKHPWSKDITRAARWSPCDAHVKDAWKMKPHGVYCDDPI